MIVVPFCNFLSLRRFGLWCLTPLSTYFSYIIAVSFNGGGNRSTRRIQYSVIPCRTPKYPGKTRPAANNRQTLSHNVEIDSNSQR